MSLRTCDVCHYNYSHPGTHCPQCGGDAEDDFDTHFYECECGLWCGSCGYTRPPDPARDADFRALAIAIDRDPTTPMLAEMVAKYGEDDQDIRWFRRFVEFMEAE